MNYNSDEIRKAITTIKAPGELFEIRIIEGKTIYSGYFKDAEKAVEELSKQRLTGKNVFITLNKIKDACYSRAQHDCFIKIFREPTTGDKEITRYEWLLIDLDPERPAGVSSSNDELQEAAEMAKRVCSWLSGQGFKDPVISLSGNGYHLLYKIDLPNTAENEALVKRALKALDVLFSTEKVKIDTSVYNPARISKLYGTAAQKGASTEERPHRMSKIIKKPEPVEINGIDALKILAAEYPEEAATPQRSYNNTAKRQFDVYEFLNSNGIRYTEKAGDGYTKLILDECIFNPDHKAPDAAVTVWNDGTLGYKCFHDSCSGNHWREFRLKLDPHAYDEDYDISREMGFDKPAKASKPDPAQKEPTAPEPSTEKSYFSKNQQLTMLGNWLNDNHREDIALFGIALFDFKNLYTEIVKGGKTFLQIMAENKNDGVTITAITAAVESAGATLAEATYQEAKAEALLAQREKLIEIMARPGVDIPFVTDHLLRVQAAIDQREVKPAAANLSEMFLNALDKDAQALKIKYGRGFEDLDKKAGSMKAGQLIVLAARPATGKSAAALQIAYNVANKGAKTLFFPLEMTTQETLERLILQQEIIESKGALAAPTDEEKTTIKSFLDGIESKGNLLFYEGVNNLEAITQTIKEQRPAFVVIDQLTQVRTARRTKDIRERYVEITADLKHIAIEYQTTILLLTQLNRDTTKQSRPTLENLHESDATGQNADVVLLMQKRDPDESTPDFARHETIDIYVVKNRGGQSEFRITVKFYGNKTKFCRN